MTFPLCSLSSDALLAILQKTNVKSLCRLRRAGKPLDLLAEENRNRIKCSVKDRFSLKVTYDVSRKKFSFLVLCYFPLAEFKMVKPFKQLSAISFLSVSLFIQTSPPNAKSEKFIKAARIFRSANELKTIFCEKLDIATGLVWIDEWSQILRLFEFSEVTVPKMANFDALQSGNVKNCKKARIAINGFLEEIFDVLRFISVPSLEIAVKEPMRKIEPLLAIFLVNLQEDYGAKGKVENLRLTGVSQNTLDIPDLLLWKGDVKRLRLNFYFEKYICTVHVMETDKANVVMINMEDTFEIKFTEGSVDEFLLLEVVPELIRYTPYDLSSLCGSFVAVDRRWTFEGVMEKLKENYV